MSHSTRTSGDAYVRRSGGARLLALGGLVLLILVAGHPAFAQSGGVAIQGLASDFLDRSADDYGVGLGYNILGLYRFHPSWDLRADLGFRWIEGEKTAVAERQTPDLGGRPGELTEDIQVMPFTLGVVHRFERWSRGRFWVPYASAGLGFYDMEATYEDATGEERKANRYEFGWNLRAGVNLHRTSGLFLTVESALHMVDTDRRWTPLYDVSVGVGTILPVP